MVDPGWQVFLMPAELPVPSTPLPFVELPVDWDLWLAEQEVPVRTPFLLSPRFEYDVGLNAFFRSGGMVASACNTQVGYARDVAAFASTLRIRRYTQNHTFSDPRLSPAIEARGGQIDPFDGVAELWWDSVEDLFEARCTAEGQIAGRALLSDERTFIDLPNSPLFFTNEHLIIST